MTYVLHRLARESIDHQVLDPFLIGLGRSRMPSVQTIKLEQQRLSRVKPAIKNSDTFLDAADIATAAFKELVIQIANFLRACYQLRRNGMTRENHPHQRHPGSRCCLGERGRECS
jgi:hypothetical protein